MDSSRSHRHLLSFVASAMLTSGFFATAPNPGFFAAGAAPQPAALLGLIDGARNAGWSGQSANPAANASPAPEKVTMVVKVAAKGSASITPEQFRKLIALIKGPGGFDFTPPQEPLSALGLTAADMPLRGVSVTDDDDPQHVVTYEMWILPHDSGYAILHFFGGGPTTPGEKASWMMKLDANLKPLSGWRKPIGSPLTPMLREDIPSLYSGDMTEWAKIADALG